MSEKHLVDAYLEGRIDRRRFIQRLVGGGVSIAVALTYADLLPSGSRRRMCSARLAPPPCRTRR